MSRRFKALAKDAGLPPIKLHEGRHSAASLARDAAVDPEIRRKTLGHADQAMTSRYTNSRELHQLGEKPQVTLSAQVRNSVQAPGYACLLTWPDLLTVPLDA